MKLLTPVSVALATCIFSSIANAETTPNLIIGAGGIYKIEDFLPEKNNWIVSSGLSIYENSKTSSTAKYSLNLTSIGAFFLDNSVSVVNTKTKELTGYTSLQYGVSDALSVRGTWIGRYTRNDITDESLNVSSNTKGSVDKYSFGASWQMDDFYPLTVVSGSAGFKAGNLSSLTVSSSFSWVMDPVVLTLYPSYVDGVSNKKDDIKYRYFSTTGIISIALNNDLDIKFGASKDIYGAKKKNPHSPSWDTSTSLMSGVTFNSWKDFTVDFTVDHELGGMESNTFSLDFSWRI